MVDKAVMDNLSRLGWMAALVVVLNVVHVALFSTGAPPTDPVVGLWKQRIIQAHAIMAVLMTLLLAAVWWVRRPGREGSRAMRQGVEAFGCATGLGFTIALVSIDQAVTPSITPYLVGSVLGGALILLRPVEALLFHGAGAVVYWYAMTQAQSSPTLLLTNLVNGAAAAALGLLLSVLFWRKHVNLETLVAELRSNREQLLRHQAELEHMAVRDGLTGLWNRAEFRRRAENELALAQRHGQETSLVLVDLDHFKLINDNWGHPVGDTVLVSVADTLRQGMRATDELGRLGGEEFIILLPHTSAAAAIVLAERLREAVMAQSCPPVSYPVTASFGVASQPGGVPQVVGQQYEGLYADADAAVYAAKHLGRNRVESKAAPVAGLPAAVSRNA